MKVVGYILIGLGLIIAFGNLTGGGLANPQNANFRLGCAGIIVIVGALLAFAF
jgi:hypothetical protein